MFSHDQLLAGDSDHLADLLSKTPWAANINDSAMWPPNQIKELNSPEQQTKYQSLRTKLHEALEKRFPHQDGLLPPGGRGST